MKLYQLTKQLNSTFFTSTVSKLYCWLSRHICFCFFAKCTYTSEKFYERYVYPMYMYHLYLTKS